MYSCCVINARSIVNKLEELHCILYSGKYDILCITETWLHNGINNGLLDPRNMYDILRKDRANSPHGGVAVFINRVLDCIEVTLNDSFSQLEVLCVDLVFKVCKLRCFIVYRPPSNDSALDRSSIDLITDCLSHHAALQHTNIVVGDFNCPKINWEISTTNINDYVHCTFLNWVVNNGFMQFVTFPTRGTNTLDLVLCDDEHLISNITYSPPIGHSDHCVVDFSFVVPNQPRKNTPVKTRYNWHAANYQLMGEHLCLVNWLEVICANPNALDSWYAFLNILWYVIDLCVPQYQVKPSCAKRYPKQIVRLRAKKRRLWKQCVSSPSNLHLQWQYRECAHEFRTCCQQFTKQREEFVINTNSLGAFYRHVNSRIRRRDNIGVLIDESGCTAVSDDERAAKFNDFFASTCVTDNGVVPPCQNVAGSSFLETVIFSESEVLTAMKNLKSNLSSGPDALPPLLFKKLRQFLAPVLALLFTQLFSVATIPHEWHNAIIAPVFKKGIVSAVSNYRLISLTCVASKIMERVVSSQIYNYLCSGSLLSHSQHGFVKGRSTCTNLLESMNDWTLAVQNKEPITVAYIDFARAFDTVSHTKLFTRLYAYGIRGKLLEWIKCFFCHHTHQTRVGDFLSEFAQLLSGVIQGSGIGPVMFIVFIDDLAKLLKQQNISIKLYADDVKLYLKVTGVDDAAKLQFALDTIIRWSDAWQLTVSVSNILNIGRLCVEADYNLAETVLPCVESCRDLGITVVSNLSPSQHISQIVVKAHQRANCVLRSFTSGDVSLLTRAFVTYVRPLVEYNSIVWSPYLNMT